MIEKLEMNFIQQKSTKRMYVTSNPFFAFHDDVFPAFSKNALAQPRFPRPSGPYSKTIIPDSFFSSLDLQPHISTLELNLKETEIFHFVIDISVK